jgi:hypothetical protein
MRGIAALLSPFAKLSFTVTVPWDVKPSMPTQLFVVKQIKKHALTKLSGFGRLMTR